MSDMPTYSLRSHVYAVDVAQSLALLARIPDVLVTRYDDDIESGTLVTDSNEG